AYSSLDINDRHLQPDKRRSRPSISLHGDGNGHIDRHTNYAYGDDHIYSSRRAPRLRTTQWMRNTQCDIMSLDWRVMLRHFHAQCYWFCDDYRNLWRRLEPRHKLRIGNRHRNRQANHDGHDMTHNIRRHRISINMHRYSNRHKRNTNKPNRYSGLHNQWNGDIRNLALYISSRHNNRDGLMLRHVHSNRNRADRHYHC